eukprot:jgi/Bigna1/73855/fgenesh1_pg.26_\
MKFGKQLEAKIADGHNAWTSQQFIDYKKLKKTIKLILSLRANDPRTGFTSLFVDALKKEVLKVSRAYDEATKALSSVIDNLSWKKPTKKSQGKLEARIKLGKLEQIAKINREAVRKIVKKFKKKTKLNLPTALDLTPYSFGSDSELVILGQRLEAFDERANEASGENSLTSHFGKQLGSPQKLHILVELTRMRKLLVSALEWASTPGAKVTGSPLLLGNIARNDIPSLREISASVQIKKEPLAGEEITESKEMNVVNVQKVKTKKRTNVRSTENLSNKRRRKERPKVKVSPKKDLKLFTTSPKGIKFLNTSPKGIKFLNTSPKGIKFLNPSPKGLKFLSTSPKGFKLEETGERIDRLKKAEKAAELQQLTDPGKKLLTPVSMLPTEATEVPSPFQAPCPMTMEIGKLWNLSDEAPEEDPVWMNLLANGTAPAPEKP